MAPRLHLVLSSLVCLAAGVRDEDVSGIEALTMSGSGYRLSEAWCTLTEAKMLQCDDSSVIKVRQAKYNRNEVGCSPPEPADSAKMCNDKINSKERVKTMCDGKRTCQVLIEDHKEVCPENPFTILTVMFMCVPGKPVDDVDSVHSKTPEEAKAKEAELPVVTPGKKGEGIPLEKVIQPVGTAGQPVVDGSAPAAITTPEEKQLPVKHSSPPLDKSTALEPTKPAEDKTKLEGPDDKTEGNFDDGEMSDVGEEGTGASAVSATNTPSRKEVPDESNVPEDVTPAEVKKIKVKQARVVKEIKQMVQPGVTVDFESCWRLSRLTDKWFGRLTNCDKGYGCFMLEYPKGKAYTDKGTPPTREEMFEGSPKYGRDSWSTTWWHNWDGKGLIRSPVHEWGVCLPLGDGAAFAEQLYLTIAYQVREESTARMASSFVEENRTVAHEKI